MTKTETVGSSLKTELKKLYFRQIHSEISEKNCFGKKTPLIKKGAFVAAQRHSIHRNLKKKHLKQRKINKPGLNYFNAKPRHLTIEI